MINKKRLFRTFIELLKIKSPSKNEKEIVDYVRQKLKELGLKVNVDRCGSKFGSNAGNVTALYRSKNPSASKPIFLAAHLDTVSINGDIIPVIKNGKIFNKNKECILGGDDKAAVAAILEVLNVIKEKNISTADIYIIFTICEEIGVMGSKCINMDLIKAKYGFAFDSDGDIGAIINKAPYQNSIYAHFKGKSAHAGIEPEKGVNSIKAAAVAISSMKIGRIDQESTCNVGKIEGGVARNIVAEDTKLELEVRSLKLSKLEKITDEMVNYLKKGANKIGARLNYEIVREYDGYEITENEIPVQIAKTAMRKLKIKPKIISSGGGSDINIFNKKGKISLNLSNGMENIHTNKEFVRIEQLVKLAGLILEICKFIIN
ncbi:MAG TPA: M20/M25/M40 family metallo-hydrolase [Candidatus Hydromicrobium sp.]